jgi:hypothetical protein
MMAAVLVMVTPAHADTTSNEAAFVARINSLRASHGAGPLSVNGTLTSVARSWASHMAGQGTLSHNPSLSSQAPRDWTRLGENVGQGPSVDVLQQAFTNSSAHYANMINPAFTSVGVGVVMSGSTMWVTEDFMTGGYGAAPAPVATPRPPAVHRAAPVARAVTGPVKAATKPAAPAPTVAAPAPAPAPPKPLTPSTQLVQSLAATQHLSQISAPSNRAAGRSATSNGDAAGYRAPVVAHPKTRPIGKSIAVGFVVAILVSLIGIATVALPLFAFARVTEPAHGLNRPFVHTGLVDVAIPAGVVAGTVTGAVAGRAFRRGTKLPQHTNFYEDAK